MQQETTVTSADIERLSRTGRALRITATLLVAAALTAGTWGTDDLFPFGPFRMYLPPNGANQPVDDTRVVGINADGEWLYLHQANTGFRRAEFEGQLERFRRDPELLAHIATAYAKRRPSRPPLVKISIVVRWWEVQDGRATGEYTDDIVVVWTADGERR